MRVDVTPGSFVARYRVGALLGRGSGGAVHAAWDSELEREVALKTIAPSLASDPRFIGRFRRESRLAAALEHPSVVTVFDAGEADGVFFIAMRLIRGRDLRALLSERGLLPVSDAVALLAPVASALDAAHLLELVHRDVKPANILIGDDGRVYLADFGLARTTTGVGELSSTGNLVGTVDYVAPEQIRGDVVTGRADQYSLACVLFECLTGHRPFERESELATLWAHVDAVPPLPSSLVPNLPASVDEAVAAALSKAPSARFATCSELIDSVEGGRKPSVRTRGPFVGLAAFDAGDAPYFFGREQLVREVVQRLGDDPIIALVGPSGSGKSSILRAGVLPSLARASSFGGRDLVPLVVRPGEQPATMLSGTLAGLVDEEDVLFVLAIDQFEELFTVCRDEHERSAFIDELRRLASSDRYRVVLAIRDDYFGASASYPEFAAMLDGRSILVRAMSRPELELAIVGPAARAGVTVEPALADALLGELADEPAALPLLAASLRELWDAHLGEQLTLAASAEAGGVRGAIARIAEEVYGQLDVDAKNAARRLLLRLAAPGANGEPVRRRVALAELDADGDPPTERALAALDAGRLVLARDGLVEVTHEALFREWPRLRAWLEEDADGRQLRVRLAEDAAAWETGARDAADLYRGVRLASALAWASSHDTELNRVEREFLEAGHRLEQRSQRRLRATALVLAALLAVALAAGFVALRQRSAARREARTALAGELGAEAVSEPRIDRAMLLAREATNLDRSVATAGTLLATLVRSPAALATFALPLDTKPYKLTVSPNGRILVVADQQGALRFYDTTTRRPTRPTLTSVFGYAPPAFSPDGSLLLTVAPGSPPPALQIRAATTLKVLHVLRFDRGWLRAPETGTVTPFGITRDKRTAYFAYDVVGASGKEGSAFLDVWDVASGRRTTVRLGSDDVLDARIVGRSRLETVTSRSIETWTLPRLRRLWAVRPRTGALGGSFASISPDGRVVAAFAGPDAQLEFVDAGNGRAIAGQEGPGQAAFHFVRFSPDDHTVATTLTDGRVILWDSRTGQATDTLVGHGGDATGADFTADGRTLYTSSLDGAVFEWDIGGMRRFGQPFRIPAQLYSAQNVPLTPPLAVSPDSSFIAARIGNADVGIYRTKSMKLNALLRPHGAGVVAALGWSSRGRLVAAGTNRGAVVLWSVAPLAKITHLLHVPGAVQSVGFTPDGGLIAATDLRPDGSGQLTVWRAGSGSLVERVPLRSGAGALAFSRAGAEVAVGMGTAGVAILDTRTWRVRRTLRPVGENMSLAFTPDGRLLTGAFQGLVQRWDPVSGAVVGQPIRAASGPVASISVAPGGAIFTTSSATEGVVRLWTTSTMQQFGASLPGPPEVLTVAQITPDARSVIVLYSTGAGIVWPISLDAWRRHACSVAGRNFSLLEWAQYVQRLAYTRTCPGFPVGS